MQVLQVRSDKACIALQPPEQAVQCAGADSIRVRCVARPQHRAGTIALSNAAHGRLVPHRVLQTTGSSRSAYMCVARSG